MEMTESIVVMLVNILLQPPQVIRVEKKESDLVVFVSLVFLLAFFPALDSVLIGCGCVQR
jgi:hypothetical protein